MAFLYNNNTLSEREIKKRIPFTIVTKKIRYLGIYFTKEVKDLLEKIRILKKETDEYRISGSKYHVHGLDELASLICPYYPKQSIHSMQFLLKYLWHISQV